MTSLSPHSPLPADPCFMLPLQSYSQTTLFFLYPPFDQSLLRHLKRWSQESSLIFVCLFVFPSVVSPPPITPSPRWEAVGKLMSPLPPRLLSRRASWGSRRYWLSWWRCHQSQMGGQGSGKGQSKCQGSEREGPWAGLGGNREAPPVVFLLLLLLSSQSASSAKAVASHPGGVLVWEPAPPYQEGWPEGGRNKRTLWLEPLMHAGMHWSSMGDQESFEYVL